jgi:AraC-like DNA-binding protein
VARRAAAKLRTRAPRRHAHPPPESPAQRVGPLVSLPGLLRELGADPAKVLARAGLAADALDEPERFVTASALGRLLQEAVKQTGCHHVGLLLGQRARLAHFGLLGELMRYSATVGEAMHMLAKHQRLNNRVGATYLLEHGDVATFGWTIYRRGVVARDQIYDGVLAMGLRLVAELRGGAIAPITVSLAHAPPADARPYRRAFHCAVRFDADQTAMFLPARVLAERVAHGDPARRAELEARAAAAAGTDIDAQVRAAIRLLLMRGSCSGDEAAAMLSMHRRTLNRRLAEIGTTYRAVLDDVRFETARELLEYTNIALIEIATTLGYEDASAFSRSFRRWAGCAPSQWRASRAIA